MFKQMMGLWALIVISSSAGVPLLYIYGDVSADGDIPSGNKKPFHQMRLNDDGARGLSQFKAALEEVGFDPVEKYDAEIEFAAELLDQYKVLILGSNQRRFTEKEALTVKKWVEQGGGLAAWSDSAFGGFHRTVGLSNPAGRLSDNDITAQFGMYFCTDNGGGNYLIAQYEQDHYLNNFNKNAGVRFRGEGVSCVRVSLPAIMLAKLQDGGLGGKLKVNKNDGTFNPKTDAALAVAEIEKGRVVGVFDRNLLWNAGEGTRLSHVDNREFLQRVMLWAAGLDKTVELPKRSFWVKGGAKNMPPKVNAGKGQTVKEMQVDLSGTVSDDQLIKAFPDVRWKVKRGPKGVTFENDNPNTLQVRAFFKKPGTYVFQLTADDGEFTVSDDIRVKVRP